MGRIIFLLEEPSMQEFLDNLLPRLFPTLSFHCVPHEGKDDLDGSISATLRDWQEPGVKFVIVRDNDDGDCYRLKERLRELCRHGHRDDTLIRIVCQELEAWYLGDPDALADAFCDEKLRRIKNQPRYRNPDSIVKPSTFIKWRIPSFGKRSGARAMAQLISRDRNRSHSFAVFLDGVEKLVNA